MEEKLQPEAAADSDRACAPKMAPTPPFTATKREKIAAFLMYALAYLYIRCNFFLYGGDRRERMLAAFTLGFVALAEYLHRETPRVRESWVWLGCVAALLCAVVFNRGHAWNDGLPLLFLHVFAPWWALSRSGALLMGESGRLLPLDALDGFIVFPFKHFFLRLRTAGHTLSHLRGAEKRAKPGMVGWSLAALAAAAVLLVMAANLLMAADAGFAALLAGVADFFHFNWSVDLSAFFLRLLLSLPVGAYLHGLIAGTLREDKAALRARGEKYFQSLEALRKVPNRVWTLLTTLFCLLYLAFFVVQARYLFGAFTRTLPEGFVVAEYARQGFFELCRVMAVNFALLWLVTRSSRERVRGNKAALMLCLALLAESFLFAVVAFSKLALYISCFGFTPKRLQSTWLVCVLAFGCACAALSLARERKTFRIWMMFGAVTLSLLCLY